MFVCHAVPRHEGRAEGFGVWVQPDAQLGRACVSHDAVCRRHDGQILSVRCCNQISSSIHWPLTATSFYDAHCSLQQVAAMAFGSDLQAAMAFSGILVVIMVAIFPGLLKLET